MTRQNRSTAVMARRNTPVDGLDYFPTPPWGTRALCELILGGRQALGPLSCWESACGEGDMARPLAEYFGTVYASDVFPYGFGEVGDFLDDSLGTHWSPPHPVDWVVTNPPFNAGVDFARRALSIARVGVALLLRATWLESGDREPFFAEHPLSVYAPFIGRLPMVAGRLDRRASSATAYAWFVWIHGASETRMLRIPSTARLQFDRDTDWPRAVSLDGTPLFSASEGTHEQ